MRRPLILVVLALLLALGAAACGGGEEGDAGPDEVMTEPGDTGTTTGDGTETEGEGTTTDDGAAAEGDPVAGKAVFAEQGCGGCHVLADAGSSGSIGPNLDESKPDYDLVVERVTNGKGAMPPFDELSEADIQNVAAYVSESAGA